MNAVGRIGGYISRGVSNVSIPFHPFGGAVDIIVVEQPDGSFKTSPWYVQFGKFQGVLKAKEKRLSINVNGVDADFYMYLDNNGEAYFVREVYEQEVLSASNSSSVGHDTDEKSVKKTEKFHFLSDGGRSVSDPEFNNRKKQKSFELFVKSQSAKENGFHQSANKMDREGSLERAEMAARLLEVQWSTNLATKKSKRCDSSRVISLDLQDKGQSYDLQDDTYITKDGLCNEDQSPASSTCNNYMDTFTLEETYLELKLVADSSRPALQADSNGNNQSEENEDLGTGSAQENSEMTSFILHSLALKSSKKGFSIGEEQCGALESIQPNSEGTAERLHSYRCCETGGSCTQQVLDEACGEGSCKNISFHCLQSKQVRDDVIQPDCFVAAEICIVDPKCQSTLAACSRCTSSLDINDSCDSLTESCGAVGENGSGGAMSIITASNDVESDQVTEVGATKQNKSVNLELSLTNSSISEEQNGPGPHAQEEDASGDCCTPLSSNTLSPRADNKDNRLYEVAFLGPTTGIGASITPEVEQFLMEGLYLSEDQKVELVESIVAESTGKKILIEGWSESSEIMVDDTADVVDASEFARGNSTQVDPKQLEASQTLSISSGPGIIRAKSGVDDQEQMKESISSLGSNETANNEREMNAQRVNLSNSGASMYINGDIPPSLEEEAVKEQQSTSEKATLEDSKITEDIRMILSEPAAELSLCGHLLREGMGYEAASSAFDAEILDMGKLTEIASDLVKDTRLVVRIGGHYFPWDAAVRIVSMIGASELILDPTGMIAIDHTERVFEGNPETSSGSKKSKWKKIWPFMADKSNSVMGGRQSISLEASDSPEAVQKESDITQQTLSPKKKVIKTKTPTSEQLASMNLKEGKNTVTFTFSTPMLGEQKVDARIFLWNWNARIVISDVDGTITKSDVLGQFMPLMGYDWSQTGVAHLFSAIKENGYELLFLSARAISQAYLTRQFLINLKQDGKALPEGPVVISPDGLFPSLFREVIRRAPHEFKITCLEDIKALFPPDCNPFYAGFGNRHTDEISYLKVGIPRGKIFTINPKGQVSVHRRVDTKSYSCLHSIVHDMFPPPSSTFGTEQEDYNSWNFWRIPSSDIF